MLLLSSRWISIFRFHYFYLRNDPSLRNHSFVYKILWVIAVDCMPHDAASLILLRANCFYYFSLLLLFFTNQFIHSVSQSVTYFVESIHWIEWALSIQSQQIERKKWNFLNAVIPLGYFFKFSLLLFLFFGIFHFILSVFFFHFEFHGFNNILYTLQHLMTQKYCVTLPQIDLFFWFYDVNFSIMPSNGRDTGFLFFVYDQIVQLFQLFQLLPNILWFFVFLSYIIVSITCKLVLNGLKVLSHCAHNEHKHVFIKKLSFSMEIYSSKQMIHSS